MGIDKPNQTDPSAIAESFEVQNALGDTIAERVADAISAQNPQKHESETVQTSGGGSGSDVAPSADSSSSVTDTNPNAEVLKLAEASTGRKFASADEFQKYLTNLNSLVGDQSVAKAREAAKAYDALVTKLAEQSGKSVEETKKFWADELIQATFPKQEPKRDAKSATQDSTVDAFRSELDQVKHELQQQQLLSKYPFAAEVKEEIAILARQKGITEMEAFENSPFKSLLEARQKEEAGKSPVVTSSNRIGFDQKNIAEKAAKVVSRGTEEDKMDLVKQFGKSVGL